MAGDSESVFAKYVDQAQRYPQYAEYQRMTTRTIPVVALTPTGGAKPRE